jgi:hypothetical protein
VYIFRHTSEEALAWPPLPRAAALLLLPLRVAGMASRLCAALMSPTPRSSMVCSATPGPGGGRSHMVTPVARLW